MQATRQKADIFNLNNRLQHFAHTLEHTYVQTLGDEEGFFLLGLDGMGTLFLILSEEEDLVYGFQLGADTALYSPALAPHPLYGSLGWVEVRNPTYADEKMVWLGILTSYRLAAAHPQVAQPTSFAPRAEKPTLARSQWMAAGGYVIPQPVQR